MKFNFLTTVFILTTLNAISPTLAQGRLDRPTFFRDGQEMMEREIQRLQQVQQQQPPPTTLEHPSQLLTVDEGTLRWQKYLFRDGGFSVWMPQGTQSEETVVLETDFGQLPFEVFSTNSQGFRFVAAYSEKIDAEPSPNPEAILSAVRDGIVAETKLTLLRDRSLTWEQYTGKELTMRDEDEIIAFRLYLINQRVYVLAAGQKNVRVLSEEVVSFFDSFRLL